MTAKPTAVLLVLFFTCNFATLAPAQTTSTSQAQSVPAPAKKIAVIRIHGRISESPPMLDIGLGDLPTGTLRQWSGRIKRAATDKNVTALVLLIDQPVMGWAQVQELGQALQTVHKAGKKIYCQANTLSTLNYLLACRADQIALIRGGELSLVGLAAQSLFFKDLLDKIGLEADVEHIGQFKLAGEPFTRSSPSEFMDQQVNGLLDSLYDQMIQTIAKGRDLQPRQVKRIIDTGPFSADRALKARLIDKIASRDQFLDDLTQSLDAKLLLNYGRAKPPKPPAGLMGIIELFGSMVGSKSTTAKPTIALIYAEGLIVLGDSQDSFGSRSAGARSINRALRRAQKDKNIKAVVMRIDSPGGSAIASEAIWQQFNRLAKEKPAIASMGNVAASGGYYIACPAQYIFTQGATITGSIGIIGGKLVVGKLLDKVGISCATYLRGANAGIMRIDQPFDDLQRQTIRSLLAEAYDLFKERVITGRAGKIKDLKELAGGRIFTGKQAVEVGLADDLGGLDQAIKYAAKLAGIEDYKIQVMPEPKTIMDLILEGLGYQTDSPDVIQAISSILIQRRTGMAGAGANYNNMSFQALQRIGGTSLPSLPVLGQLPVRWADMWLLAQELARHRTLAVMPFSIEIK